MIDSEAPKVNEARELCCSIIRHDRLNALVVGIQCFVPILISYWFDRLNATRGVLP